MLVNRLAKVVKAIAEEEANIRACNLHYCR